MLTKIKKQRYLLSLLFAIIFLFIPVSQSRAAAVWLYSVKNTNVPTRIAIDAKGNVYVTDAKDANRLVVFDRKGNYLRSLGGLQNPIGVAVDGSRIYIGNEQSQSVDVYTYTDTAFTYSFMLGSGKGAVKSPNSIAVGKNGLIYVVDSKDNRVKVYNQDGTPAFNFGGWGANSGQFNIPLGLAIDDPAGELYVTDMGLFTDPVNGSTAGARIQVFDMNGGFRRSFGTYGTGDGKLIRPLGVALDGTGKVYITDTMQGWVGVFDTNGVPIETIHDSTHPMTTPIGIAIGKDKRLFVASSNGPSVDAYGLPGYTTLSVSPANLSFAAIQGGTNPSAQSINVVNTGSGTLNWTAQSDGASWLSLQSNGTSGPDPNGTSGLAVSVNAAGLAAGSYSSTITLTADSGAEEKIGVSLTVSQPPAILSVVPGAMSFKAQKNGPDPQPLSFTVSNTGSGNMAWSAAADAAWLKLTASAPFLVVSPNTTSLNAGTYSSAVTIAAPGAQGSPATVVVTVDIVLAGTVKVSSTVKTASFDITGPITYSGSGGSWSSDAVTPGDYTITFKPVPGYLKPASQKFTVKTGQETDLNGNYLKKAAATHIIAGSVPGAGLVSIQPLTGGPARSFFAFKHCESGVSVAAGDMDASGFDKIAVTDNRRTVRIFSDQGLQLASAELPDGSDHAAVAVGDIDNDGKAEILVSVENENSPHRTIKIFSYSANALQERGTLFTEDKEGSFSVALGDVNGDGSLEVLIADSGSVRAFAVQQPSAGSGLAQLWNKSGRYGNAPRIASGDIDGDGVYEIAVSYEPEHRDLKRKENKDKSPVISILKGSGENTGILFAPFKDLGFVGAASVAMGDIDGDLADELVAGAGPSQQNDPVVRTFETDGTYAGMTVKPLNGKFGVNVGLAAFQQ